MGRLWLAAAAAAGRRTLNGGRPSERRSTCDAATVSGDTPSARSGGCSWAPLPHTVNPHTPTWAPPHPQRRPPPPHPTPESVPHRRARGEGGRQSATRREGRSSPHTHDGFFSGAVSHRFFAASSPLTPGVASHSRRRNDSLPNTTHPHPHPGSHHHGHLPARKKGADAGNRTGVWSVSPAHPPRTHEGHPPDRKKNNPTSNTAATLPLVPSPTAHNTERTAPNTPVPPRRPPPHSTAPRWHVAPTDQGQPPPHREAFPHSPPLLPAGRGTRAPPPPRGGSAGTPPACAPAPPTTPPAGAPPRPSAPLPSP